MVRDVRALDAKVGTWRRLPQPRSLASYDPGTTAAQIGNIDGFAIPPAWIVPGDLDTTMWLAELRKTSTLYAPFQVWEAQYSDPRYLATISLGELGSRIEWTIHNWMHMRWTSVTRDPSPDKALRGRPIPEGRAPLDFDSKWLDPEYDYLGETFSSHVNPIFWRLHGRVDDRIDDWFRAQENARPGTVKRKQVLGVDWFETDGHWVLVNEPWEGLRAAGEHMEHGGHGHGGLQLDVPTMQSALTIIYGPEPTAAPAALAERVKLQGPLQATWFRRSPE
jgi:hypothetical protein